MCQIGIDKIHYFSKAIVDVLTSKYIHGQKTQYANHGNFSKIGL